MAKSPVTEYLVYLTFAFVIGVVLEVLLWKRFSPNETTLLYLYSSIFQGLAALLGILLVMMSFSYQRAYQRTKELKDDISKDFMALSGEETSDVSLIKKRLTNWRKVAYIGLISDASKKRARMESKATRPDSGFRQDFTAACQNLKRNNDAYRRIYNAILLYELENGYLKGLPLATAMTIGPMIATIFVALPMLAMTGLPGIGPDYQSAWVVIMVYMTMLSILLAVRYISNAFNVFFPREVELQQSDAGIPSPQDHESEYREAIKGVDLRYMPVSSDDPVDELGYVRMHEPEN